jgi:ferritin
MSKKETELMKLHPNMVEEIIDMLKHMDVDGETMQYIIDNVGMNDQMLRQLVMTNPYTEISELLKEKMGVDDVLSQIATELATGDRESKINLIIELAGDEYETLEDAFELAKKDELQINKELLNLYHYYDNE